jgi:hypothetical protein
MDDLIVSGTSGVVAFVQQIKAALKREGLTYRHAGFPAEGSKLITGVVVTPRGMALPNRRHKAVFECIRRWRCSETIEERQRIKAELLGRLGEAAQIDRRMHRRLANRVLPLADGAEVAAGETLAGGEPPGTTSLNESQ